MKNGVVFGVGRRGKLGAGKKAWEAGTGVEVVVMRVALAEAGIGLTAATRGLVKEGTIDVGDDDVAGAVEVEGGIGAFGEGVQLGLR